MAFWAEHSADRHTIGAFFLKEKNIDFLAQMSKAVVVAVVHHRIRLTSQVDSVSLLIDSGERVGVGDLRQKFINGAQVMRTACSNNSVKGDREIRLFRRQTKTDYESVEATHTLFTGTFFSSFWGEKRRRRRRRTSHCVAHFHFIAHP